MGVLPDLGAGVGMTATVATMGVHSIGEEEYFSSKALSYSGMKLLLSSPALFKHRQDNPAPPKKTFDYGHAAHQMILGSGAEIVAVDADNWRTKAAQAKQDEAYAAGQIPLLTREVAQVKGMAHALLRHPQARKMFLNGRPEQSLFWTDPASGVNMRCRLDWLPNPGLDRMVISDYKTAVSASGSAFRRAVVNYGYHQQHDHYSEGVRRCGVDADPRFVFVVQEKTAPYLVQVFELDDAAVQAGRELNRQATNIFSTCVAGDAWPGYSENIERLSLPPWYGLAPIDTDEAFSEGSPF